jgi:outer membrane receptor for ferrienterochelin and colicins
MQMKQIIIFFIFHFSFFIFHFSQAQRVTGTIYERNEANKKSTLIGVNVFWIGTTIATQSDTLGRFSIPRSSKSNKLILSYVGYKIDTLNVNNETNFDVIMKPERQLGEVVIRSSSTVIDRLNPIQTEIITTKALAKSACCNLSESFETNASVSVSYADAVTGAKQIQLLGLSGTYIQMNAENIPTLRGLATTFGLNYIPGTWIQSIDIGKGAGSVVTGYESMTGQINVELQKPDSREKLYFNAYVNNFGRVESNLNLVHQINKKWSSALLLHGSTLQNRVDNNSDGFLDLPLYSQFNAINRWKYQTDKIMIQFGVKALYEDRLGGQNTFYPNLRGTSQAYGFGNVTSRYEVFSKMAKLYQNKPYKGLALILNGTIHDQKSYFGFTNYNGLQNTLYSNLIYQSIIDNTNHQFKTGASFVIDDFQERYKDSLFTRHEVVPGIFWEYTFNYLDKLVVVAGGRVDFHNLYGLISTPRLHLKYQINNNTLLRLSAGRGFRVANPLAEYYGNLVSSRTVIFKEKINPEIAWNYGASLNHTFHLFDWHWDLLLDYYRTQFESQLVADFDHPQIIYFYNSNGQSYANSFQVEINVIPTKRLELKLAYRLFDVQQSVGKPFDEVVLLPKMMIARDRVLFNIGYALPYDKWKFDLTIQWNGARRIPYQAAGYVHTSYVGMPVSFAPSFINLNAQVSRAFPKFEVYIGSENLTDFKQANPIYNASDPFGRNFDAGQVWGPVTGRMVYAGIRVKVKS